MVSKDIERMRWPLEATQQSIRIAQRLEPKNNYRHNISNLDRELPVRASGEDRKKVDIAFFFKALSDKKSIRIELTAMDMRKAHLTETAPDQPASEHGLRPQEFLRTTLGLQH